MDAPFYWGLASQGGELSIEEYMLQAILMLFFQNLVLMLDNAT